jgi:putative heme-binding domain-containing protein
MSDVRQINDNLAECRGLLWMDGWLYAHANRSKKLVRLRDTRGDGSFETEQTLLETGGGYGHGRNHIKPGPDGRIWVVQGNNVLLPAELSADSPLQFYAEDQLLPNPWDGSLFDGDVQLPAGHILSMNPDGSDVQLVAGGLRNPLDLAFNRAGHAFTFDADMERDLGSAWYMPTRVLQIVPGADYGWRRGTGRWPAAFPDSLPSVVDIGLASPTAVFFGYGAAFPKRDEEALFICDWSYGRIIAVRLQAFGEGYRATQESFITGRPLNVTDGAIGPDGALWFITGGRSTQSGLYRVSYHGSGVQDTAQPAPEPRSLAPTLDPFAQHRLRMELEKTGRPPPGITALSSALATARTGTEAQRLQLLEEILEGAFTGDPDWLRVLEVTLCRLGWSGLEGGLERLPTALRQRLVERLEPHFPHPDDTGLNHQLLKFLVYLRSPGVIEKAVAHLAQASSSEDLLFYPMILRYLKSSEQWTEEGYRTVFTALNAAEKLRGASSYFKAIADTRGEFATALKPEVMTRLADVVSPPQPASLTAHALPAHTFKQWTLADLEPLLPKVGQGRSYEGAKKALVTAQCVACHRVSADNSLPAGILGPDLSQVSARFGRRDLLLHTLEPSLAIDEKYRLLTVTQKDGSSVTGTLESEDDERITLRPNPLDQASIEIGKSLIVKREEAPISPMPTGLLNSLKAEQILDLLAWFEANGQNDPRIFY